MTIRKIFCIYVCMLLAGMMAGCGKNSAADSSAADSSHNGLFRSIQHDVCTGRIYWKDGEDGRTFQCLSGSVNGE